MIKKIKENSWLHSNVNEEGNHGRPIILIQQFFFTEPYVLFIYVCTQTFYLDNYISMGYYCKIEERLHDSSSLIVGWSLKKYIQKSDLEFYLLY